MTLRPVLPLTALGIHHVILMFSSLALQGLRGHQLVLLYSCSSILPEPQISQASFL